MDTIVGNYYVIDNKLLNSIEINFQFNNSEYLIYEVIRTSNGVLLFLEDHLERLYNSIKKLNLEKNYNEKNVVSLLRLLVKENTRLEGNIKLLCKTVNHKMIYAAYYIPHFYPSEEMYRHGVKLITYEIERNDPQIKQVKINEKINEAIKYALQNTGAFEALLINHEGHITECSKSNFFLINGNFLYSAPEESILKGITRNYVLKIAKQLGFENKPSFIKIENIENYEAAFICGTSPKVMPVKAIDGIEFNVGHKTLQSIKLHFDKLLADYFKKHIDKTSE
jgi:branched-chain amino acid aminotransferase